ncbi:unannotated protein [freshwater metagenome]|uniref:Unannotated protein n=1 Tax=freshwater metagenome TaxID=449393 RepID=A0A6J7BWA1_9ZZZZ
MTVTCEPYMSATLITGGRVLLGDANTGSFDDVALVYVDGVITWIGAVASAPPVERTVYLEGAVVLPAFVDGHVHATDTGLALTGLDLSSARSKADVLAAVSSRTRELRGRPILGHGWDESSWVVKELPTSADLDRASFGSVVYLARVDAHSALVSGALLASVPRVETLRGFDASGIVSMDAHHAVRGAALRLITPSQRTEAQSTMLRHAASKGVAVVHEMAGPDISSADDAAGLMALSADPALPDVVLYWGQHAATGGLEMVRELGAHGAGGDLFVDGALGSRTACLRSPYADQPTSRGALYLDHDSCVDHLVRCSEVGVPSGFHVIGDAAMDVVVRALRAAEDSVGAQRMRALRHRLEHVEMIDAAQIAVLADLGVIASVQPAFDAAWGGTSGMYADRLGLDRGAELNPFAALVASQVELVLGSDSPVTAMDPWGSIRAAVGHRTPAHAIDVRTAFDAHTRAGFGVVGDTSSGVLAVGATATFAIWHRDDFDTATRWPILIGDYSPSCMGTVRNGSRLYWADDIHEVAS